MIYPRVCTWAAARRPPDVKDEHKEGTTMRKKISEGSPCVARARCVARVARSPIKGGLLSAYLEEQHEADPLIIRVVFPCFDISEVVGHSWMGDFHADLQKHETSATRR